MYLNYILIFYLPNVCKTAHSKEDERPAKTKALRVRIRHLISVYLPKLF